MLDDMRGWLQNVRRELTAAERVRGEAGQAPAWAIAELPGHAELIAEIESLHERERRLRRMCALLWETGEPLNKVVRGAFRDLGYPAELTEPGATFDVVVPVSTARLLIEVTGIEGQVNKGSKKIAQVLTTRQRIAAPGDRICLAVNAHRSVPVADRKADELITREALELIVGLGAVVFTTVDLFRLWRDARGNPNVARPAIDALFVVPAGVNNLTSIPAELAG